MILNVIKDTIISVKKDRTYLVLLILQILSGLWVIIDVLLTVKTSQLQTWFRFTSFNSEWYNRTNWMYGYSWAILALVIMLLHTILSVKFLKQNYRELALLMLGAGVILMIISSVNFNMIMSLPR
ncbi:MAG: hypothetical protein Q3996_02890 [Candidatus Saccharibacteria bacterium]|nr:hypothetical protein [Candidatus Saccharibacteria bacterium]